jgi:integrase
MLKAGLRRGEVLALEHSDIHDNRIYVSKAVKYIKNRPVIGQTKNESSERSVPLFVAILPFLSGSGLILPDEHGNLCSETAFNRAWESYMNTLSAHLNGIQKRWYHLTKEWIQSHPEEYAYYNELLDQGRKAEAEEYRLSGWREICFKPHDLRHTFVSTGRDKGVDVHTMMSWCGHSSERMILEIYDHLSESREQHAIEMMDD